MSIRLSRTRLASAALAALAAVSVAAALPADAGTQKAKITKHGVDGIELGMNYKPLHDAGLIGHIRPGCEFGGPNTRSAPLRQPLKGQVNFTLDKPRKVTDVNVRGGAKARGVGIGAKIPAIKDAFPKAKVIHATEEVFGVTLVRIPKDGGGRIVFAVDVDTKKTTIIGVPFIAFCE